MPIRAEELAAIPRARSAVVVFGSGSWLQMDARIEVAMVQLTAAPEAIALLSGATVHNGESEAAYMKRRLSEQGVAAARLFTESASERSTQNARFSAQMLVRAGVSRVTLVTSDYHALRAHGCLWRALRGVRLRGVRVCVARAPHPVTLQERWRLRLRELVFTVVSHVLWEVDRPRSGPEGL